MKTKNNILKKYEKQKRKENKKENSTLDDHQNIIFIY